MLTPVSEVQRSYCTKIKQCAATEIPDSGGSEHRLKLQQRKTIADRNQQSKHKTLPKMNKYNPKDPRNEIVGFIVSYSCTVNDVVIK